MRRGLFDSAHRFRRAALPRAANGGFLFTVNSVSSVLSRLSMQFRSGVAWKVTRLFFYLLAPRLGA